MTDGLTIHEAAETTGWSPRMLRYLETVGLIEPSRTSSGYRVFGPEQLQCAQSALFSGPQPGDFGAGPNGLGRRLSGFHCTAGLLDVDRFMCKQDALADRSASALFRDIS